MSQIKGKIRIKKSQATFYLGIVLLFIIHSCGYNEKPNFLILLIDDLGAMA